MALVGTNFKCVPRFDKKENRANSSAAAFDYYVREGAWSLDNARPQKDDPCIYQEHNNYPIWAKSPKDFWLKNDGYSRGNARLHTHFRIEFPREFSLEMGVELGRTWLAAP